METVQSVQLMDVMYVVLATALTAIIGVVGQYVKAYFSAKVAEAEKQANNTELSANHRLKSEVETTLYRMAMNVSNKELLELQEIAKDGKIDKDELRALGAKTIANTAEEFKSQGIDIISKFGNAYLESSLRWVVDKINTDKTKEKE